VIPVGGMLPGLITETTYESESLQLSGGERIAFFTDGLFESAADSNARKLLETQITSKLSETLKLPIRESLQKIMSIFDKVAGTPPKDDVLLLLIEPVITQDSVPTKH
jgi:serine phosphatase RsbU (regulator of sigma subunit)